MQVHAEHHPTFRALLREKGYYDIFLFDLDGNLIYSVFKELDYATNFVSGPYAESGLGKAFRAAVRSAAASVRSIDRPFLLSSALAYGDPPRVTANRRG